VSYPVGKSVDEPSSSTSVPGSSDVAPSPGLAANNGRRSGVIDSGSNHALTFCR
jgi:hypothetical protein